MLELILLNVFNDLKNSYDMTTTFPADAKLFRLT